MPGREIEVSPEPAASRDAATTTTQITGGPGLWVPIAILLFGAILLWRSTPDLAEHWRA